MFASKHAPSWVAGMGKPKLSYPHNGGGGGGVSEIPRGALIGVRMTRDPTVWGQKLGVPDFRKVPYEPLQHERRPHQMRRLKVP